MIVLLCGHLASAILAARGGAGWLAVLSMPADVSAQSYGYDQPSVVVECAPGQRVVMEHRAGQLVARCGGQALQTVVAGHDRRPVTHRTARPVAKRSTVYVQRAPRRTKTKTALTIAGSAATGAGIGGIVEGKKGALIGTAIGGGVASIYEAARRR